MMDINHERNESLKQLNARFVEGYHSSKPDLEVLRQLADSIVESEPPYADMAYDDPSMEAHDRALPKPSTRLKNRLKRKRKK